MTARFTITAEARKAGVAWLLSESGDTRFSEEKLCKRLQTIIMKVLAELLSRSDRTIRIPICREADKLEFAGVNLKVNIKLVKLSIEYKAQLFDMLEEWKRDIEINHTNHSPWMIFRNDYHDFEFYLDNLEIKEESADGKVPDTTLFCLDTDRNIFVGAVNIRHYLNERLLATGGHIGDGIRPSERRKGYATAMIALALEECKKLGIDRVLMCCNKDNIGSAKSIIKNGGVLENEVDEDGTIEQRYWIDLSAR